MRIAMVAPLMEAEPPALYGGTERAVSVLTEELVRRGHNVTLFAPGDSRIRAALVPCAPCGLRLDSNIRDDLACAMMELSEVSERGDEFDFIHNHLDYVAVPLARTTRTSTVTATHGRLDQPEVRQVYHRFADRPLVAISDTQRATLTFVNWDTTVRDMVDAAPRAATLDRRACLAHGERRFSPAAMADGYECAYAALQPARSGAPKLRAVAPSAPVGQVSRISVAEAPSRRGGDAARRQ